MHTRSLCLCLHKVIILFALHKNRNPKKKICSYCSRDAASINAKCRQREVWWMKLTYRSVSAGKLNQPSYSELQTRAAFLSNGKSCEPRWSMVLCLDCNLLRLWWYPVLNQHSRQYCTTGPNAFTPSTQGSFVIQIQLREKCLHSHIPELWQPITTKPILQKSQRLI